MKPYLLLPFLLAVLLLGPKRAAAQDAEGYFHVAAQEYVGSQLAAAIAAVDEGLQLDPDNAKLRALKERLEEERQQQQNQQGQQQDQNNQDGEQDQQQEQQGQQQQNQEQQGGEEQEENQQEEGQQQQQQQPSGTPGEDQRQENQQQQGASQQPDFDKLSPEQAERILQALGSDEEQLLREVMKLKARPRRVEKDW